MAGPYNSEKTFFSGIVDADLGDLTRFQPVTNISALMLIALPGAVTALEY